MGFISKNIITESEKEEYIRLLTSELPVLRIKADVSQDELSSFIGASRQTYGAIERRERSVGWKTFLSLIFFFDNNSRTKQTVRSMDAFPHAFINQLNASDDVPDTILSTLSDEYGDIFEKPDKQALHSVRTMIMIVYTRCTNQSGETVVKAFDGMSFMRSKAPNTAVSEAQGRSLASCNKYVH